MLTFSQPSQLQRLIQDVKQSLINWHFWTYLGWNDIVKQYRRSFIGPVWVTLNTALFIVAFGLVGAQLFKMSIQDYLPYFCAGNILFGFLSALVNDGCQTYIAADAFLKQTPYPKTAFVLRVIWRNLILLAHNLIVVLLVLLWFGQFGGINWLGFVAGLVVTVLAGYFVVAILGAVAVRFRDIPMIIGSIMQISFFITPVMWQPEQLTERAQSLVRLNPLANYLAILRQPLLGRTASLQDWLSALGLLALLGIAFVALYRLIRRRIVYWL